MKKKTILKINFVMLFFFIIIGYLALIVLFHEVWHIIKHGLPDGVCIGIVNATGGTALGGLVFNPTQPLNLPEEENAWVFGAVISSILFLLFVFTEVKLRKKYE